MTATYATTATPATAVATTAIASQGSPRDPHPHVALLNHADVASSDASTTIAASAKRNRMNTAPARLSVEIEVRRKFVLSDVRARLPEDGAAGACV